MWGPQGGGRGSGVLAHYTPPSPRFFDSSDVPAAADTGSGRPGCFLFFISFLILVLLFSGVRLRRLLSRLRFLAKKCVKKFANSKNRHTNLPSSLYPPLEL